MFSSAFFALLSNLDCKTISFSQIEPNTAMMRSTFMISNIKGEPQGTCFILGEPASDTTANSE